VAVFLIPAVALLSWLIEPLALSFRQVEILVLAASVVFTSLLLWGGRSTRARGIALIGAYVAAAAAFYAAGDR
jgi:Ca2+/H+ antiporter